jgi:hypothetical protein
MSLGIMLIHSVFQTLYMVIERESDTRFSTSGFSHGSVSPGPMNISLGPF